MSRTDVALSADGPRDLHRAALSAIARRPTQLEVVIPAYNEAGRLPHTVESTAALLASRPWDSTIVVVDNASVDDTAAVAQLRSADLGAVGLEVVGCAQPGKGAAVRRGFLTSRAEVVGFMDADLATPIDTLDRVMRQVDDGADVVIASRYIRGAAFATPPSTTRRLGSNLFHLLGRQLAPGVSDTQCGFKFLRGDVARELAWASRTDGFAFDLELLSLAIRAGCRVDEVPVRWTAQPGSTFRPIRDGVPSFAAALQLRSELGRTRPGEVRSA